jgi:hypothetical protein
MTFSRKFSVYCPSCLRTSRPQNFYFALSFSNKTRKLTYVLTKKFACQFHSLTNNYFSNEFSSVLRSRIIFMRLRLRVKILMLLRFLLLRLRLRLLPYCIARQNFYNELKFKHKLKLSFSFDSVRFILLKI